MCSSELCIWLWTAVCTGSVALVVLIYYTVRCCLVMHRPVLPSSHSSRDLERQQTVGGCQDNAPPPSYDELYPNWKYLPFLPVIYNQLHLQNHYNATAATQQATSSVPTNSSSNAPNTDVSAGHMIFAI